MSGELKREGRKENQRRRWEKKEEKRLIASPVRTHSDNFVFFTRNDINLLVRSEQKDKTDKCHRVKVGHTNGLEGRLRASHEARCAALVLC